MYRHTLSFLSVVLDPLLPHESRRSSSLPPVSLLHRRQAVPVSGSGQLFSAGAGCLLAGLGGPAVQWTFALAFTCCPSWEPYADHYEDDDRGRMADMQRPVADA